MRTSRPLGLVSLFFLGAALASACGSPETEPGGTSGGMPEIAIAVSPDKAAVLTCSTQKITATVTGTEDTAVSWKVDGDATQGTVDEDGNYTAPIQRPDPNEVTVVATAHADPAKSAASHLTLSTALPQKPVPAGAGYDDTSIFHHQVVASGKRVYAALLDIDKNGDPYTYKLQVAASGDGGKTFAEPVVASDVPNPNVAIYCPSLAVDAGDEKTVYLSYMIDAGPFDATAKATVPMSGVTAALAVSKDAGATWKNYVLESHDSGWGYCPDVASPAKGTVMVEAPSFDFASPYLSTYVDATQGAGFAAGSGDMYAWATSESYAIDGGGWLALEYNGGSAGTESPRVFGDGNHDVCVTFVGGPDESNERVAVRCSTDDGKTMGAPVDVDVEAPGVVYHHPVGLFGNGMITIAYWAEVNGVGEIRVAQSKDSGKTFAKPTTVPKYLIANNDLANDAQYPAIAWDGGTLWLAYLVSDGNGPNRLVVDKSCDGGTTWSGAEVLNGEPPVDDRGWPAIFVADGKVEVASQRHDGDFMTNDVYEVIQLVP